MSIFETATAGPRDGSSGDLAILIDAAGAMRIVEGAGWSPEGLQAHYGARTVYQVSRTVAGVQVSGRSQGHTCILRSEPPNTAPAGVPLRPGNMPWTMPHPLLLA